MKSQEVPVPMLEWGQHRAWLYLYPKPCGEAATSLEVLWKKHPSHPFFLKVHSHVKKAHTDMRPNCKRDFGAGFSGPYFLFLTAMSLCFPSLCHCRNLQGEHLQFSSLGPLGGHARPDVKRVRWENSNALTASPTQNPQIPHGICKSSRRAYSPLSPHWLLPVGTVLGRYTAFAAPWWKSTEAQWHWSSNPLYSRGPSAIDFYPFSPAVVYKTGLAWTVCTRARFILGEHSCAWH